MSAQFEASQSPPPAAICPQCSQPIAPEDDRCPACGYALAGVAGRPGPYAPAAGAVAAAAFAVAYVIALVIVLLGR